MTGEELRAVRRRAGLTQPQMAQALCLSLSQYAKAESGVRNLGKSALCLLHSKFGAGGLAREYGYPPRETLRSAVSEAGAGYFPSGMDNLGNAPFSLNPGVDWCGLLHQHIVENKLVVETGVNVYQMSLPEALRPILDQFVVTLKEQEKT